MPPNRHAVLSASSSHRWLHCNPSARLELEFEHRETEAAAEGTAAHALAEHKLRKALKMRSTRPVSKYDSDEMEMYTDSYLEFVLEAIEEARQDCPDPKVLIEQRLDFSCYVPDGFGTGDCLIVADKLLHIIDLKYGQGVLVNAEENPQMMLYALGALRIFDCLYDIETVSMTIYQPRRENVSTWVISVAELRDWAEKTLKPKAELAFKGEGEYCPGNWCQFCKAAVKCRARADAEDEPCAVCISMPRSLFNDSNLENLKALIAAKGSLIKKALGVADLPLEITDTKVSFPWFPATPTPDEMKAYDTFICKLCEMARNQKRINATEKPTDNEKYAFRCFLLRLGFIGAEYKTARKILLKNLSGSSAFRNGGAQHEISE